MLMANSAIQARCFSMLLQPQAKIFATPEDAAIAGQAFLAARKIAASAFSARAKLHLTRPRPTSGASSDTAQSSNFAETLADTPE